MEPADLGQLLEYQITRWPQPDASMSLRSEESGTRVRIFFAVRRFEAFVVCWEDEYHLAAGRLDKRCFTHQAG